MPGLRETLELVVSANVGGAVSSLESVGKAADKNLGKTDSSLQKLGGRMQATGAAMVGTGAVIVAGLVHVAEASEEAQIASLKLQNSLDNSPEIADKSSAAFDDLADSLREKTVVDDEAVRTSEALLIQFGLTKDEVLGLTPLVVDLSRKMGVDLDTASKAVGKAMDGNAGALKKMGISVDETAFKTDKYSAVQKALQERVGGFAEAEGKTFSGQLQIMQNQLGELEEGVGVGVVDAFSKMFGAVDSVTGALDSLSPGAQSTIGEIATFGSVGLIAVGAFNLVAGTVIKFVGNLGTLRSALGLSTAATEAGTVANKGFTQSLGSAAAAMGPLAIGAGIGAAALAIFGDGTLDADQAAKDLARTADGELLPAFEKLDKFDQLKVIGTLIDSGDAGVGTLVRLRDAAAAAGKDTAIYDAAIVQAKSHQDSLNASTAAGEQALGGKTAATDEAADADKKAAAEADAFRKAQEGLVSLTEQIPQAMQKSYDSVIAQAQAHSTYEESVDNLTGSLRENLLSLDDSTEGGRKNIAAIFDTGDAIVGLIQQRFKETQSVDDAKAAGALYVENLKQQLTQAGFTEEQVQSYIDTMNLTPDKIDTLFSSNAVEQQIVVGKYLATIKDIPPYKQSQIEALLLQGKYGDALQIINGVQTGVNAIPGYKSVTIGVQTRFEDPDGPRFAASLPGVVKRWGGIDYAAGGRLAAGVVNDETVLFGERATGGEAFIPRIGNPRRSRAILAEAAGWYGLSVGQPGAPTMLSTINTGATRTDVQATYQITVNAGIGTSGAEVGDAVVKAIKQYEQRNGAGWRN